MTDGTRNSLDDLVTDLERQLAQTQDHSGKLLAKYVVGYRLVNSDEFSAVMQAISEVLEGMIGLTRFELYLREGDQGELLLCTALPDAGGRLGQPALSSSVLAAAERGSVLLPSDEVPELTEPGGPTGWFPIRSSDRVLGGIAVFDMLPHKKELEAEDLELLDLICSHGADAIAAGDAYSRRKYRLESFAEVVGHRDDPTRV